MTMIDIKIIKKSKTGAGSKVSGCVSGAGMGASLSSVVSLVNALSTVFVPVNASGARVAWDSPDLWAVKSVKGFYSEEFVSARGLNADAAGGVAGATALSGLTDVALSNPSSGQALVFNGSKWVNESIRTGLDETALASYLSANDYARKSDIPGLTGYATETWVANNYAKKSEIPSLAGYATETWVANKGYLTRTDAAALYQPKGDYLTGHQAIYALTLQAGTFTGKIYNPKTGAATVNIPTTTSHVSEGGNLYFTNARAVAALKTTTDALQANIDKKLEAATFETFKSLFDSMFVRETDAASPLGYRIRAKYGLYSDHYVSARGSNPNGGGTSGGAFYLSDLLDTAVGSPANGNVLMYNGSKWVNSALPSLAGYATEAWVEAKKYLTAHQPLYTLTIQKNGTTVGTYKPDTAATINITDVASAATLSSHTGNATVHITAAERTKWNKVVTDFAAITGTDSDTVINKWEEVVAFLATYTEADTLAGLLGNKADKSQLSDYVTLGTAQTITGNKTFSSNIYIGQGHYIYGANETMGAMIQFDGTRTIVGSVGESSTVATHLRSKTGHLTVGTGNSATYHVLDTGNYATTLDTRYVKKSGDTMTGALQIDINSATKHLGFGRAGYNYIAATSSGGVLGFVSNGKAANAAANCDLIIGANSLWPGTNNLVNLGTTGNRWKTVNSVLGNFSGLITAAAGIKIGEVTITYDSDKGGLHITGGGLYADTFISARGANGSGGGASGNFGIINSWGSLTDSNKTTNAISAELSDGLRQRIATLEGKNYLDALTLVASGAGNAVTAVTLSSDKKTLTVTKGATFLTAHQSLANYVTLNTAQTITGIKTFARDAATDLYVENTGGTSTSNYSCVKFRHTGADISGIAASKADNMLYRTNAAFSETWKLLDTGNYTDTLDTRYVKKSGDTMTGALYINSGLYVNNASPYRLAMGGGSGYVWFDCRSDATTVENNLVLYPTYARFGKYLNAPYFTASTTTLCTNLNADLLDGIHANGLFTALTRTGAHNNTMSATIGGTTKTVTLYPISTWGMRYVNKTDNGGRAVIVLIADITSWKGSVSAAPQYGFTGRVTETRTGGYMGEKQTDVICRCGYADETGTTCIHLRTSYRNYVCPKVILYNGKYYLGLWVTNSGHDIIMEGYFHNCLSTFITLSYDANNALPSGASDVSSNYPLYEYSQAAVFSATKLLTARTINGTTFDGTANITTANWGTARSIGIVNSDGTGTAVVTSVNGSANINLKLPATIKAALTGNATTATTLQTARTLWGQSFNGSSNVSGNMTSVGNITGSAAMTISSTGGRLTLNGAATALDLKFANDDTKSVILNGTAFKPYDAATHKLTLGSPTAVWERIYGRYIDTDSGYYLRICTAGTERLTIRHDNGYVGIGTTAPAYLLDVNGAARVTTLRIGDATISYDSATGMLKFDKGIYSTGAVSARGANSSGGTTGSGLVQKVYGSGSLGGTFSDSTLTDTFNAYTVNAINNRLKTVETGGAMTVATTGSGNAVTSVTKSGTAITVTKGTTFLTAHQSLANYVTLNSAQTITGIKTFARDAATDLYVENTGGTSTSNYSCVKFRHTGADISGIAASKADNMLYRTNAAFSETWKLLDTGNYSSVLGTVYQAKGNYVTTDTAQTITGAKTFGANVAISNTFAITLVNNSAKITKESASAIHGGTDQASETDANLRFGSWYGFGWYPTISGQTVTRGNNAMWLNARTGVLTVAGSFVKKGGTALQVLMADGSVQPHYKAAAVTSATSDDGMITPLAMNQWTTKTFVTALGTSGNYLTWTKNGTVSNITVPYATTSQKVGTATVGSGVKPIYLNAGTPTASASTVGSGVKPMYLNAGTMTASSSTVGGTAKPMWLNAGTMTALSATAGAANLPVWLNAGTIQAVTSVGVGYLSFGGANKTGSLGPCDWVDGISLSNKFEALPAKYITVEKWNATTSAWVDAGLTDLQKQQLVSTQGCTVQPLTNNGVTGNKLRVTIEAASGVLYFRLTRLNLNISTNGLASSKVLVEFSTIGTPETFAAMGTYSIEGWSGWNSIYLDRNFGGSSTQTTQFRKMRLTFSGTATTGTNASSSFSLINILAYGATAWSTPNTIAKYGRPYTYALDTFASSFVGDILPSANVARNLGSATYAWSNTYTNRVRSNTTLYLHSGSASTSLIFCIGDTEKMRIAQPNGYVGILKSDPAYALDVGGQVRAAGWFRTVGSYGWYSETYGGGWYMSDSTWIRSYGSKSIYVNTGQIRCDGYFNRQAYTGTSWNAGYGAYNVEIADNSSQTPLMVAYRAGQSPTATGSNRIFALELLNSGTTLHFAMAGAAKFRMINSGDLRFVPGTHNVGCLGYTDCKWQGIWSQGLICCGDRNGASGSGTGVVLNPGGGIELSAAATPYIDFHYADSSADYTSRIIEEASGRLAVIGTLRVSVGMYSNGYVSARGQNTSSDERLKQILRPIELNVRDIASAPCVEFVWKKDGVRDVGSIAQYWRKLLPQLAPDMPDGTMGLQYGKTALMGVIAVAKKTVSLEERVAELERENRELKKELETFKSR